MNPEIQDLARRAVACKHWRWMPGMRALDGAERFRVCVVSHGYPQGVDEQPPMKVNVDLGLRWFPDLTDPATLGCLLALVLEIYPCGVSLGHTPFAAGSRRWHESQRVSFCVRLEDDTERFSRYGSIAEALVAALEAAP